MILSIGEILVDQIVTNGVSKNYCGGAPFNLIVNAKRGGATAGFIGRVGNDEVGKFLLEETSKYNLDYLDIQVDIDRKTTIALVTLTDGERDFKFLRNNTADYNIDIDEIDFSKYKNLSIIHLGSLMLSEEAGKTFAQKVYKKAKDLNVLLSFDMNFRMDTYKSFEDAKKAYAPYVECADIIKFSDDELKLYTGIDDIITAIESIYHKNQLFVLTLGSKGSLYYYNGAYGIVPTKKVTPVDTTGAGDAFFGTFLAGIENKEINEKNIKNALVLANQKGAETTQFLGAIKLWLKLLKTSI